MAQFRKGDKFAAGELLKILYPELRRLAAAKMKGERADHTWQPTLLVNELYLALMKSKALGGSGFSPAQEKAVFLGLAGHLMKRLLIEHSRPLSRRIEKVEFREAPDPAPPEAESLSEVEEALARLAAIDPRMRAVVEMRVFEGLTGEEIAGQLGCSARTVTSYWNFARRWLEKEFV
jgi:RNA polymerase sigma factor (TIGR02999 family)